ncbi:MAG: glycosyl hydrolase family 8 [Phycisphaerae bacterium]|nr:glycosyl hydrolase family 8 [Phycisphaerae bacterium]MDD5380924.1 glycosyl hydrolase family 8 [Phycisphaerae bacterium]
MKVLPKLLLIVFAAAAIIFGVGRGLKSADAKAGMLKRWAGFKHYFIDGSGRVKRPDENDSVSEGQAYAMLRAVWLNDKETFDKCYIWTENNMSRYKTRGDNLLAWRWKGGKVIDFTPASDADIDYALALIFADARWGDPGSSAIENYGDKAKKILDDILNLETYSTVSGRLYLSPWIYDGKVITESFAVNPSYYSPAHFRIFYKYTQDKRWLKLVDTTYYMLNSLSRSFAGQQGIGLIPDWCSVDMEDKFGILEGKGDRFGYESIRIPFRVGLDYFWFKSKDGKKFLKGFSGFLEQQFEKNGIIFCEYDYAGDALKKFDSPAFYSCYYYSLSAAKSRYAQKALEKNRSRLKIDGDFWFYENNQDYYLNCLSWLAEGLKAGVIEDISN